MDEYNLKLQEKSVMRLRDNGDVRLSGSANAQRPRRCLIQQHYYMGVPQLYNAAHPKHQEEKETPHNRNHIITSER